MIRTITIVLIIILLYYFLSKYSFQFKSLYHTLKINPLLRMKLFRVIGAVLYRLFIKRKIF